MRRPGWLAAGLGPELVPCFLPSHPFNPRRLRAAALTVPRGGCSQLWARADHVQSDKVKTSELYVAWIALGEMGSFLSASPFAQGLFLFSKLCGVGASSDNSPLLTFPPDSLAISKESWCDVMGVG